MFSGIVESQSELLCFTPRDQVVEIKLSRPSEFNDLHIGDSVAVNGVCLTIEEFNDSEISFCLAAETLHITQWTADKLTHKKLNLERSLCWGDRVHGHLVTGHVDGMGVVSAVEKMGENLLLWVKAPQNIESLIWKKGSVTLNGVSLTINEVKDNVLEVCLIPETQKRTNLGDLKVGSLVAIEADNWARGLERQRQIRERNS